MSEAIIILSWHTQRIGGDLVWLQPEDDSEVEHYQIYLAEVRDAGFRT